MGNPLGYSANMKCDLKSVVGDRNIFFIGSIRNRHNDVLLGGQRVTIEHASILRNAGINAYIVTYESGVRGICDRVLNSFGSEYVHYKKFRSMLNKNDDIVVLPGRYADRIDEFPGRNKVLFSQGIWVTLRKTNCDSGRKSPFKNPTLRGVMVVSDGNADMARLLRPNCPVVVVRNAVTIPSSVPDLNRDNTILYPDLRRCEKNPWDTCAVLQVLKANSFSDNSIVYKELKNIPHSNLLRLMKKANVLLFLSTHEGLGLLPLEAMANGVIVFGYDRTPMSDILHSRCIFKFGDIEGISCAVQSVIERPDEWSDVRIAGYYYMQKWSKKAQIESIYNAYETIIKNLDS